MKRLVLVTATALVLGGCYEEKATGDGLAQAISAVGRTEVSNNSPDVAVKSWWRAKDSGAALQAEICKNNLKLAAPYFEKLSELSTDDVYNERSCGQTPPLFERQITKVEVQSDTRAVVTAQIKNVTPPEEGAVLDADDKKAKEAGEPFQYVLERKDVSSSWKISQVSRYPSYARAWEQIFKKPEPSTNRWVYEWLQ
ncbi:hypothetical protein [Pseudomonas sp. NMI542_15]|uniref:hypothetical protein n=1 Tax=Pseudomonas sp. NMI542_15 TaxID=2903148 RepID=UPI001E372A90|nr:hypothetical protein [Pseudomonas sp. NMI542_15]MCE0778945.1 hypothetical protein [Pseudomonas sp. NMI542_15]